MIKMMKKNPLSLLSSRLIKALIHLASANDYMTVSDLAAMINTSTRTLFRELKDVDIFLEPYEVHLEMKPRKGIRLVGERDKKLQLKSLLLQISAHQQDLSKEDRQLLLVSEVLKNQAFQKLIVYAKRFKVSEATISNDIDAIEPQLKNYGLNLIRKPGNKLILEGSEESLRKAIRDFVFESMEETKLVRLLNDHLPIDAEQYFLDNDEDSILSVLDKDILTRVIRTLKEHDVIWVHRLAQNSYIGLILHLSIAIERLRNEETISLEDAVLNKLKEESFYEEAKILSGYLEEEFDLIFPEAELAYITMHLKGSRLLQIGYLDHGQSEDGIDMEDLRACSQELIRSFEKVSRFKVESDEMFIEGLMSHLRPALTRLNYGLSIRNPLLNQIKEQYRDLFDLTQEACMHAEDDRLRQLNEDEIGFICVHFGAVIERMRHQSVQEPIRLAVICASGIGISSLLASKIRRNLHEWIIVEPKSQLEWIQLEEEGFDILVSTIELEKGRLPIIHVNPLLSDSDIQAIQQAVRRVELRRRTQRAPKVMDYATRLRQIHTLSSDLLAILDGFRVIHCKDDISYEDLLEKVSVNAHFEAEIQKKVLKAIEARETMGLIVMEEEEFAMIHARVPDLPAPVLHIYRPENCFSCYPSCIRMVFVLLVPDQMSAYHLSQFSKLSAALIEEPDYKRALMSGALEEAHQQLTRFIQRNMLAGIERVQL